MHAPSSSSDPRFSLGVDIGGTKTAMGLVSPQGALLEHLSFETRSRRGIQDMALRLNRGLETLLQRASLEKNQVSGMGLGCPGPLNLETGEVLNPYTLPGWALPWLVSGLTCITHVFLPHINVMMCNLCLRSHVLCWLCSVRTEEVLFCHGLCC